MQNSEIGTELWWIVINRAESCFKVLENAK